MNRTWLLRSVVVVALVLAACGGDSKDKASTKDTKSSTTSSSTSTTVGGSTGSTVTTVNGDSSSTTKAGGSSGSSQFVDKRTDAQAKADEKLAESAVLLLADLPVGWEVDSSADDEDDSDDESDDATDAQLEKCLGVDLPVEEEERAAADSDSFAKDDATIDSDATVYPDEAYAKRIFAPLASDMAAGCIEEITKAESQAETSGEDADPELVFTDISVKRVDIPKVGDEVIRFRMSLAAEYAGTKISSVSDFVIIRGGRTIASFTLGDINKEPDAALVTKLSSTMAGRLAKIH